jgi:hypothetical protein
MDPNSTETRTEPGKRGNNQLNLSTRNRRYLRLDSLRGLCQLINVVNLIQEQEQLAALREKMEAQAPTLASSTGVAREDRPYEAGFGGQEDLEDRYATTSGEH